MASLNGPSLTRTSRSTRATAHNGMTVPSSRSSSLLSTGPGSHSHANPASTVSNVSLFLRSLRLLDFDLRPDWPEIQDVTFTNRDVAQGQKKRVQCVEWALYQLFVLLDAEEARNKLQPFFPPMDHVQSLNLRAALLRALEQAKRAGVLGRDAVVRKTMLDECKGERLEEVLAVLSSVVLKKVVAERQLSQAHPPGRSLRPTATPALALTWALENRGYDGERTQLATLALAHRVSLTRLLREKDAARTRYRDFSELLHLKEKGLVRRLEKTKATEQTARKRGNEEITEDIKRRVWHTVRNNWSGNERLMEALLYGDTGIRKDGVLSTPFDRVWRRVQAGRLSELEDQTGGVLKELETRVTVQKQRLEQWRDFREKMFGAVLNHGSSSTKEASRPRGIDFGFGAHESLQLGRMSPRKLIAQRAAVNKEYEELRQSLERSLERIEEGSSGALTGFYARDHLVNERSIRVEDDVVSELSELEEEESHPLKKSSDMERSTQQSHHSLPPANSRPAKSAHSHSYSEDKRQAPRHPVGSQSSTTTSSTVRKPSPDSPTSPKQRMASLRPLSPRQRPQSPQKASKIERPVSPTQQMADQILASMNAASPSPVKKTRHTLSLAERTRMSMARRLSRAGPPEAEHDENDENDFDPLPLRRPPAVTVHQAPVQEEEGGQDLLARTRQSMAGFEAARQKAQLDRQRSQRRASRQQRQSGIGLAAGHARREKDAVWGRSFPAVEEQQEDGREDAGLAGGEGGGNTTSFQAEELINGEQDDYEAVFMSRPKIKTSPVSTPIRRPLGDVS